MIVAVYAVDLPLQAALRAHPNLDGEALVIVRNSLGGGATLEFVSQTAEEEYGIRPGLTLAQARALCPDLHARARDDVLEASTHDALMDVARSVSPRVEKGELGWAYVDAAGLEKLIGPPALVAQALRRSADAIGLQVHTAIARSKTLARLALRAGCAHIAADAEYDVVEGLPLYALEPSRKLLDMLERLGLSRVGELLALGAKQVADKLGPEGSILYARARGDDVGGGLRPTAEVEQIVERMSLEYALENLEPLAFVLRGMLDRLVQRVALRGFLAGDLHLSLDYEGVGTCERHVEITAPTRDISALLSLCRLHLAKYPPEQPITAVMVRVLPVTPRRHQLGLFEPAGPAPDKLAVTVARLQALCGAERVGTPTPCDSYEDDAFVVTAFAAGTSPTASIKASVKTKAHPRSPQEGRLPEAPPVVLRRLRPPQPVDVIWRGGRPCMLDGREIKGRIESHQGPFRRNHNWWENNGEDNADKSSRLRHVDIYDMHMQDGMTYRLTYQHHRGCWLVHGWYD